MRSVLGTGLLVTGLLALGVGVWGAAGVKIVGEAEDYYTIKPSMTVAASAAASGGQYVWIPLLRPHGENESGPHDDGHTLYRVRIPQAGLYRLWARVFWHDSCGNSFFVIVDNTDKAWIGEDGTYQAWHWVRGKTYQLSAGTHTIRFQNREDGARLDQFLLTTDLRYVPTRPERPTPQYFEQRPQD
jgi:hypothetical protein